MGNHVDNVTEDNASDLADVYANTSAQHNMHDPGLFPTNNIFPNHAHMKC